MTEASKPDRESPAEEKPANPTSDELDIEGPNESAPGHEPDGEGADRSDDGPPRRSGE